MQKIALMLFMAIIAIAVVVPNVSAVGPPSKQDPRWKVDDPFSIDEGGWAGGERVTPSVVTGGPPKGSKADGGRNDINQVRSDDTGWGTDRFGWIHPYRWLVCLRLL